MVQKTLFLYNKKPCLLPIENVLVLFYVNASLSIMLLNNSCWLCFSKRSPELKWSVIRRLIVRLVAVSGCFIMWRCNHDLRKCGQPDNIQWLSTASHALLLYKYLSSHSYPQILVHCQQSKLIVNCQYSEFV